MALPALLKRQSIRPQLVSANFDQSRDVFFFGHIRFDEEAFVATQFGFEFSTKSNTTTADDDLSSFFDEAFRSLPTHPAR